MSALCVDVRGMRKRYGDFLALEELNLQLPTGCIFGLIGPSGSGKSTVIRMLLGIVPACAGSGTVLGYDILTQSPQIRARVGCMSRKFALHEELSVLDNMSNFASVLGLTPDEAAARVAEVSDLCRLGSYEKALAFNLPASIRQRLAFAISLIHDPDLICLDDPTGHEPALRCYFWDVAERLSRAGKTILIVSTRCTAEVERCHQICLLDKGRALAQGSPAQIKLESLKGHSYQFLANDDSLALQKLSQLPDVLNPYQSGEHIRFQHCDGSLPPALTHGLSGLLQSKIENVDSSLQDAFVAQQRLRDFSDLAV